MIAAPPARPDEPPDALKMNSLPDVSAGFIGTVEAIFPEVSAVTIQGSCPALGSIVPSVCTTWSVTPSPGKNPVPVIWALSFGA
jgi:hypothetical protein